MCGRFTLRTSPKLVADYVQAVGLFDAVPRYNIAPTQMIVVVRGEAGERRIVPMRWGLIPSWANEPGKVPLFNARSETVAEKPSFRSAFKKRRCLVPADGFFEWQALEKGKKQPLYVRPADDGLMAFAGLWESWTRDDGEVLLSCSIITTTSGDDMKAFHDRMPVILAPNQFESWLDPETAIDAVKSMMQPLPGGSLYATAVGPAVGNVRNSGAECIEPLAKPASGGLF